MLPRLIKGWGIKRLGGGMYDRHVPLHLREKPHECEFCQKRFSEKSKLQKHIEAVHSKEKHHEWEFCQGRFSHKYSLQKHMMAIHLKEKLHECVTEMSNTTFFGPIPVPILSPLTIQYQNQYQFSNTHEK